LRAGRCAPGQRDKARQGWPRGNIGTHIPSRPTIFWVVAEATNAGKTTIAEALIKILNRSNIPALGFKPFGGLDLHQDFDFIADQYPLLEAKLYGKDALRLAQASSLTSAELVEVVGPSYRLSCLGDVALVRKGAALLGNRSFWRPAGPTKFGSSLPELEALTGLPFTKALPTKLRGAKELDLLEVEKVTESYNYLLQLNPAAIVMEGASAHLPFWRQGPAVNNVFYIDGDELLLYANIDWTFRFPLQIRRLLKFRKATPRAREIKTVLKRFPRHMRKLEPTHSRELDELTQNTVTDLLQEARLI
jgi:hypothetical protein